MLHKGNAIMLASPRADVACIESIMPQLVALLVSMTSMPSHGACTVSASESRRCCGMQVASTYAALAALLRGAGRAAEALAYAQLAAAAQERAAGAGSPPAAAAVLAVAELLADLGRSIP